MPQAVSNAAVMIPAWTKPFCWLLGRVRHRQLDLAGLDSDDRNAERAHCLLPIEGRGGGLPVVGIFRLETRHASAQAREGWGTARCLSADARIASNLSHCGRLNLSGG
jgi:hypothetical protein